MLLGGLGVPRRLIWGQMLQVAAGSVSAVTRTCSGISPGPSMYQAVASVLCIRR
jgi:hypothetical protein